MGKVVHSAANKDPNSLLGCEIRYGSLNPLISPESERRLDIFTRLKAYKLTLSQVIPSSAFSHRDKSNFLGIEGRTLEFTSRMSFTPL